MNLKKEFETLVKWGLQDKNNKKQLINMSSNLISYLNSTDKKEISKEDLEKISAGALACAAELALRIRG